MPSHDAQSLRTAGRNLPVPFDLTLDAAADRRRLACTGVLRHLPGKRLVCAAAWQGGRAVVAKIFLDPRRAGRHFERERRGIQALRAAGIPTPALLFEGTLDDRRTPLLLFARMDGESLGDRMARAHTPGAALDLLRPVVDTVAALHAAGLRQRDIHPGNFLLSGGEVLVIDGGDVVSSAGALGRAAGLSNLALFFAQFEPRFDRLVPELLTLYARRRGWPCSAATAAATVRRLARWRRRRQTRFLAKTRRSCTAFSVRSSWRRFMVCDRAWCAEDGGLLDDPDARIAKGRILKAGNTATVAEVTVDDRPVVIKRYNLKNRGHALRRCLRPSRAMASWLNAHRLSFRGIATPRPLAVVEERWGLLRRRAFFVTEYRPGETLDRVLRTGRGDPEAVARVLAELEGLLAQLAAARFSHGDFKATNFLWSSGRLYLVDLDGMRAYRRSGAFKRAFRRDLRRLAQNWQDDPFVQRELAALARRLTRTFDLE